MTNRLKGLDTAPGTSPATSPDTGAAPRCLDFDTLFPPQERPAVLCILNDYVRDHNTPRMVQRFSEYCAEHREHLASLGWPDPNAVAAILVLAAIETVLDVPVHQKGGSND